MLSQIIIIKCDSLLQNNNIPENIIQYLQFKLIFCIYNLNYKRKLYNNNYYYLILIHICAHSNIYIIIIIYYDFNDLSYYSRICFLSTYS